MRILLIEDAEDLGDAIVARLRASGYAVEWIRDGAEVGDRPKEEAFDAIVLDVMLPGRDGFAILSDLRRLGLDTPVLVITARSEVDDKIGLLDLGADDYLVKPFDLREFEARLRAVMRRPAGMTASVIEIGALSLDVASRTLRVEGPTPPARQRRNNRPVLLERLYCLVSRNPDGKPVPIPDPPMRHGAVDTAPDRRPQRPNCF